MWFFLLMATCFAVTYWPATLLALICILAHKTGSLIRDVHKRRKAARQKAERRLIRNADREHRLIQQGSPDGIYGDYPIPEECRIGVWIAD